MTRGGLTYPALCVLGILLFLALQYSNAFYSGIIASILIWTVAVAGLNVVAGLGGYPSLMQGGFYGIGAYASTLALNDGLALPLAILAAIAVAAIAGLLVGLAFARTRGQYFAIGTLFFGVVVNLVLTNGASLTGGPLGLSVPLAFASAADLNIAIAASAAAAMMLVHAIGRSRIGRHLTALREDEDYAEHLGVPTGRMKLLGFTISAGFGGFAGFLIAQYNGAISPDLFNYTVGFVMFVALALGGAARLAGPLLGSALIVGVPDLLNLPSGAGMLLVGIVFVVVIIMAPDGLIGAAQSLAARLRARPAPAR
jgi:branched-chain amino acid transport system permease protein